MYIKWYSYSRVVISGSARAFWCLSFMKHRRPRCGELAVNSALDRHINIVLTTADNDTRVIISRCTARVVVYRYE